MSLKGAAYIVGAWEHPTRKATDKSVALLHAECAKGALEDAGLTKDDVDGYFCAGDAPGSLGPLSMVDYMNLKCRHVDFNRCRRFVLPGGCRPRTGIDCSRTLQRRAHHPGWTAAQRGHGHRHRRQGRKSHRPGHAVRVSLWADRGEYVRHVRRPPHA